MVLMVLPCAVSTLLSLPVHPRKDKAMQATTAARAALSVITKKYGTREKNRAKNRLCGKPVEDVMEMGSMRYAGEMGRNSWWNTIDDVIVRD